jgi:hypothetical protein
MYLLQMNTSLLNSGEDSGRLNNILSSGAGPVNVGRVPLSEHNNLGSIDIEEGSVVLDLTYNLKYWRLIT